MFITTANHPLWDAARPGMQWDTYDLQLVEQHSRSYGEFVPRYRNICCQSFITIFFL